MFFPEGARAPINIYGFVLFVVLLNGKIECVCVRWCDRSFVPGIHDNGYIRLFVLQSPVATFSLFRSTYRSRPIRNACSHAPA